MKQSRFRVVPAVIAIALLAALSGCSAPTSPFVGTWGNAGAAGQPSLVLGSDGTVSGTDGCNSLTGSWTASNGVATFGALASTLMACPGTTPWLGGASTAKVTGGQLVVSDATGAKIGTLPKAP